VNRIVKSAYERAVSLLTSHRETLKCIARSLRLHETLDARQLRAIIEDTSAICTGSV
jgi:cell division protease FtsH